MSIISPESVVLLKNHLESSGFSLSARDGRIVISPASKLPDEWRKAVTANREQLLIMLSHESLVGKSGWSSAVADSQCRLILERLSGDGWPEEIGRRSQLGTLLDAIDKSYLEEDQKGVRDAVEACLRFLNGCFPRKIRGGVLWGESLTSWNGWIRIGRNERWLPIVSGSLDQTACWESLYEYSALYRAADVLVLAAGEDPNE